MKRTSSSGRYNQKFMIGITSPLKSYSWASGNSNNNRNTTPCKDYDFREYLEKGMPEEEYHRVIAGKGEGGREDVINHNIIPRNCI